MKTLSHSRNSIYGFLAWIAPFGLTFLATPFFIRRIGNVEYGLYLLITSFIAYSFSFNFGRAITKYVAEYLEKGEKEKAANVIVSTFFLSLIIGTIGCSLLGFFAEYIVKDILLVETEYHTAAIRGFYLAAICVWLTVLNFNFVSIMQALQRFDVFSLITVGSGATLIGGNILLVWNGYGFDSMILWNAFVLILSCIVYTVLLRKFLPEMKFSLTIDREIFKITAQYSLNVMLYQICLNLLLIFERSWITRVLGAEQLTFYTVPMNLGIYIHALITSFSTNFLAMTSVLFVREEIENLKQIYQKVSKLILITVVFLCVTIATAGFKFLSLWLSPSFAEHANPVFAVHITTFGLLAILIVAWQFVEGFGAPKFNFYSSLLWFSISVPLMILLTKPFGIRGAAIARLIAFSTIPVIIVIIERKIFREIFWRFWAVNIFKLGITATVASVAEYSGWKIPQING